MLGQFNTNYHNISHINISSEFSKCNNYFQICLYKDGVYNASCYTKFKNNKIVSFSTDGSNLSSLIATGTNFHNDSESYDPLNQDQIEQIAGVGSNDSGDASDISSVYLDSIQSHLFSNASIRDESLIEKSDASVFYLGLKRLVDKNLSDDYLNKKLAVLNTAKVKEFQGFKDVECFDSYNKSNDCISETMEVHQKFSEAIRLKDFEVLSEGSVKAVFNVLKYLKFESYDKYSLLMDAIRKVAAGVAPNDTVVLPVLTLMSYGSGVVIDISQNSSTIAAKIIGVSTSLPPKYVHKPLSSMLDDATRKMASHILDGVYSYLAPVGYSVGKAVMIGGVCFSIYYTSPIWKGVLVSAKHGSILLYYQFVSIIKTPSQSSASSNTSAPLGETFKEMGKMSVPKEIGEGSSVNWLSLLDTTELVRKIIQVAPDFSEYFYNYF